MLAECNQTQGHENVISLARVFAKLMEEKVRAALRIVTDSNGSGTLPLDKVADPDSDAVVTVRDVLSKKHPSKQAPSLSAQTHHPQNHIQSCLKQLMDS